MINYWNTSMQIKKKLYRLTEKMIGGHGIGNLPIIQNLNAKAIKHLKDKHVIIDGNKMFLDKNDALLLSINKIYEEIWNSQKAPWKRW
jgi:hypothetical protein